MRGLKCNTISNRLAEVVVALYMSAWIEMINNRARLHKRLVALYMSAWIEIWNGVFSKKRIERRTLHECVD